MPQDHSNPIHNPSSDRSASDICNQAIEILCATDDGDQLDPPDLKLVEDMVNNHASPDRLARFDALRQAVQGGGYTKRWLHGIEHLTMDTQGYVYWKDKSIEHYSFHDMNAREVAAQRLGEQCRKLEAGGLPVDGATVSRVHLLLGLLDKGTPVALGWAKALVERPQYTVLLAKDGSAAIVMPAGPAGDTEMAAVISLASADGSRQVSHLTATPGAKSDRAELYNHLALYYELQKAWAITDSRDPMITEDADKWLAFTTAAGFTPEGYLSAAAFATQIIEVRREGEAQDRAASAAVRERQG